MRRMLVGFALLGMLLAPAAAQEVEPGEPEIVLPEVVLRIEDLSVENVIAGLPQSDELLPPQGDRPLPDLPEWEPLDVVLPDEFPGDGSNGDSWMLGRGLSAQAVLGAGTQNRIYGSIGLASTGDTPRFGLSFEHDMQDGFGDHDPGAGYHVRVDELEGELRLTPGTVLFEGQGAYREMERGLQGQSTFVSRTTRRADATAQMTFPLGDRFALTGAVDWGYHSDLFSGASSRIEDELILAPRIAAAFDTDRLHLGLSSGYRYTGREDTHHTMDGGAELTFAAGESLTLSASGGWYWATGLNHLFPFQIGLQGSLSPLTFDLSGGYRVVPNNWGTFLADNPLAAVPDGLTDSHGWFGQAEMGLALAETVSLYGGALIGWDRALLLPDGLVPLDPVTGVFSTLQGPANTLKTSLGIRWNMGRVISLGATTEAELLEVPLLRPRYIVSVDAEANEVEGAFGVRATARWELERENLSGEQQEGQSIPFFDVRGLYRVSERISLVAEGRDLLSPVLDGARHTTKPFEEPGINGIIKIEIDL